jgi:O-acetyl-ADP-ribose deacetylase (regulator of RNase III)
MSKINYIKGDATNPQGSGTKLILHCCNDKGAWGAGFVLALSKKWNEPEEQYRSLNKNDLVLGTVHFVGVEKDIIVVNIIGQHNVNSVNGVPPIRYDAIMKALADVNIIAKKLNATVHMPRMGCGLAGGDWNKMESIIENNLDVPVTVYDLK